MSLNPSCVPRRPPCRAACSLMDASVSVSLVASSAGFLWWYRVALGSRSGWGRLYHPDGEPTIGRGHAAFRVMAAGGETQIEPMETVIGWSATGAVNVMDAGHAATPFLAKIDIEGAEADVFAGDCSWVDRFPLLIVELHDWLYPGEGLSKPFLWAMQHFNRDFIVRGEHVISIRNPL